MKSRFPAAAKAVREKPPNLESLLQRALLQFFTKLNDYDDDGNNNN